MNQTKPGGGVDIAGSNQSAHAVPDSHLGKCAFNTCIMLHNDITLSWPCGHVSVTSQYWYGVRNRFVMFGMGHQTKWPLCCTRMHAWHLAAA